MNEFLLSLKIDDKRCHPLTKFATNKGKRKVVTSDHNPMLTTFNINYTRVNEYNNRHEIYNFKDTSGQVKFFEATEHNTNFLDSVTKPVN